MLRSAPFSLGQPAIPPPRPIAAQRRRSDGGCEASGRRCEPRLGATSAAAGALLALWPYKLRAPVFGLSAFFFVYFLMVANPLFPVTVMPLTPVDHWISFQPLALPLYVSLWLYLLVAPGLMHQRRELGFYYLGTVVLALIGLTIFVLWSTTTPKPDIDWAQYPGVDFLKSVDRTGNACPSLHVAFSVFTALWNARMLKRFGDRGVFRIPRTIIA